MKPGDVVVIRHGGEEIRVEVQKVRKGAGHVGNAQVQFSGPKSFELVVEKQRK